MPRKVKLQPKRRRLTHSKRSVPELKISGVWLEEIGLKAKAGQKVSTTTANQELIIKPTE